MKTKKILIQLLLFLFSLQLLAQESGINILVFDLETNEALPFASVEITRADSSHISSGITNLEGALSLSPLSAGTYTVRVNYIGYESCAVTQIDIAADSIKQLNIPLRSMPLEEIQFICCLTYCFNIEEVLEDSLSEFPFDSDSTLILPFPQTTIEEEISPIKIYPNPTDGLLFVESRLGMNDFYLFNLQGKLVETLHLHSPGTIELATNHLAKGIYFLKYFDDEKWVAKKIILN